MSARNNLSYTVVKSPADGVVGTLPYRVGALVSSALAQPLTTVSDNSDMYVYICVSHFNGHPFPIIFRLCGGFPSAI